MICGWDNYLGPTAYLKLAFVNVQKSWISYNDQKSLKTFSLSSIIWSAVLSILVLNAYNSTSYNGYRNGL